MTVEDGSAEPQLHQQQQHGMVQQSLAESGEIITDWSLSRVVCWLKNSLGLPQYVEQFEENEIAGDILVHLDHDALRDIGVASVGHRLTILKAVYELKRSHDVPIEQEHWVPQLTRPESSNLLDPGLVAQSFRERDEKLSMLQEELRRLNDQLARVREEMAPLAKYFKESKPLPQPEATSASSGLSLSRKFSTKMLFLGKDKSQDRLSPTYLNQFLHTDERERDQHSPNRMAFHDDRPPNIPPPAVTSPIPSSPHMHLFTNPTQGRSSSQPPKSTSPVLRPDDRSTINVSSGSGFESFKNFRLSLDDPCSKVLTMAMRRYKISGDWHDFELLMKTNDEERALNLDEKPLLLFQQLQREGRNPMFAVRHILSQARMSMFGHQSGSPITSSTLANITAASGRSQGAITPGGLV